MSLSAKRLGNAVRWEIQIQVRYGFYYAALIMVIIWLAVLWNVPDTIKAQFLPAFLLSNLNIGTFYFVGAMILYEKNQNTLDAVLVTPMRRREYLLSKTLSLILLGLVENLIVIILLFRTIDINYFWVLFGIVSMAALYTLMGIGFAVKYKDITDFLLPSMVAVLILEFPLFGYLGITGPVWDIIYLFTPLQPLVSLTKLATSTIPPWELAYGILASIFWFVVAYIFASKRYQTYVVEKQVSK